MSRHLKIGIAVVASIAGCRTTQAAMDVSAPTAIPAGVAGKIDPDGSATLYLQDLELIIEARNYRPHDTGLIWDVAIAPPFFLPIPIPVGRVSTTYEEGASDGPLTISLRLAPKVAGFTFHPGAPSVTLDDGRTHSTAEFIGPAEASCAGIWAKTEDSTEYPLLPGKRTCFVLRFPLHASPETSFLLSFRGLSLRGDPTPTFELTYGKFSGCPFSGCAVE
ncbi:MAG TPA: hypothetical protein VFM44_06300 [Gemmatimonadota bacterium]|nr:hypothetical protein [Gemmatimonadota bacterium]